MLCLFVLSHSVWQKFMAMKTSIEKKTKEGDNDAIALVDKYVVREEGECEKVN